ncbi:MAG: cobalamin biosynthesis protein CobW [Hyphomicrobiales bacterium]|nr:cobalamin biosynthesis protein CobW [Hyphomicrobiales bacterium]
MKTPATVITGFLGAGKTTLIRHLMKNANGRRLALVINEFGDLGVDREILLGCGIENCAEGDMIELANGCLCCTVADEFVPTMEKLLDRATPPDHILIETSGLALPKPLVKAFQWPDIRSRVTVDGVISIIDARAVASGRFADDPDALRAERLADPALDHDEPLAELFADQIACADLIVLNKTDLINASEASCVNSILEQTKRPMAKVVPTAFSALDPRIVLGLSAAAEADIDARWSHHDAEDDHDHDDFHSFVIELGAIENADALADRISTAVTAHDILRVKGILNVPDKPMRCVIQGVGARLDRYFDRPWAAGEPRRSQLVVIGQAGIDAAAVAEMITNQQTSDPIALAVG